MNPLTPYLAWIKLGVAGVLLAAAFAGGCHVQSGRDAAKVANLKQDLRNAGEQRGAARSSLLDAARTFDEISALTRADAKAAALRIAKGADQARQAKADKAASDKRVGALEKQLRDERAGCVDAGRTVCGLPLQ